MAVKGRSFLTISISYTSMIVYEPSQCNGSERSFIPHYFHIVYFYDVVEHVLVLDMHAQFLK